ncbi:MAG: MBL fold metallo-hydrolase, partial [Candidatus Eisenbacteria bacterium]|nr:MBL fold metallo-hydrolase [Candidatus Eisenbacteria bacterium]
MQSRPPAVEIRRARSPIRSAILATLFALALLPALAHAIAGNGKLQIHHIDVGQGDGVLVISPNGQTALFDSGNYLSCTGIKNYLQGLGITTVDYHFLSHYHSDHLGCIDDLAAIGITIGTAGYDRGYSYSSGTYTAYVNTLGAKRTTMVKDQIVTLDAGAATPVQIKCVNLNGAGVYSVSGSDENAKSLDLLVSYGNFQEEIGGDLTGDTGSSNDVESTVGPQVGPVEVYKAHHHGSKYSNNDNWLNALQPKVCVISC